MTYPVFASVKILQGEPVGPFSIWRITFSTGETLSVWSSQLMSWRRHAFMRLCQSKLGLVFDPPSAHDWVHLINDAGAAAEVTEVQRRLTKKDLEQGA